MTANVKESVPKSTIFAQLVSKKSKNFGRFYAEKFGKKSKIHVSQQCDHLQVVQVPYLVWITSWVTISSQVELMVHQ